jgi:hypothetical protein
MRTKKAKTQYINKAGNKPYTIYFTDKEDLRNLTPIEFVNRGFGELEAQDLQVWELLAHERTIKNHVTKLETYEDGAIWGAKVKKDNKIPAGIIELRTDPEYRIAPVRCVIDLTKVNFIYRPKRVNRWL